MRVAAIILGVLIAVAALPGDALARGSKRPSEKKPSKSVTAGVVIVHGQPLVHRPGRVALEARGRGRHRGHSGHCRYVPGHYEEVRREVWVPGTWREELVPAMYGEVRGRYGHRCRVVVRAAYTRRIWVPGYTRTVMDRVYVPGRWDCRHRPHRQHGVHRH